MHVPSRCESIINVISARPHNCKYRIIQILENRLTGQELDGPHIQEFQKKDLPKA